MEVGWLSFVARHKTSLSRSRSSSSITSSNNSSLRRHSPSSELAVASSSSSPPPFSYDTSSPVGYGPDCSCRPRERDPPSPERPSIELIAAAPDIPRWRDAERRPQSSPQMGGDAAQFEPPVGWPASRFAPRAAGPLLLRGGRRARATSTRSAPQRVQTITAFAASSPSSTPRRQRRPPSVDILDAVWPINPTRETLLRRVEASGRRDYGEDVADRNIIRFGGGEGEGPVPQSDIDAGLHALDPQADAAGSHARGDDRDAASDDEEDKREDDESASEDSASTPRGPPSHRDSRRGLPAGSTRLTRSFSAFVAPRPAVCRRPRSVSAMSGRGHAPSREMEEPQRTTPAWILLRAPPEQPPAGRGRIRIEPSSPLAAIPTSRFSTRNSISSPRPMSPPPADHEILPAPETPRGSQEGVPPTTSRVSEDSTHRPSPHGLVESPTTTETDVPTPTRPAMVHEHVVPRIHHIAEERSTSAPMDSPAAGSPEVSGVQHYAALIRERQPIMLRHAQTVTYEGLPREETAWRHPAELESGARKGEQTVPLHVYYDGDDIDEYGEYSDQRSSVGNEEELLFKDSDHAFGGHLPGLEELNPTLPGQVLFPTLSPLGLGLGRMETEVGEASKALWRRRQAALTKRIEMLSVKE